MKFRQWLQEIALGSGMRDMHPSQTADSTMKVGQSWLGRPDTAVSQANLVNSGNNKSVLASKLLDAGAQAVQKAPGNTATQTTAPKVAGFLQQQLKLPAVINK